MSNESQNQPLQISDISERFSFLMLTAKLFTLELELKEADLEMIAYPNEFSAQRISTIKPMIEDLRKAVDILKNGY